MYAILGNPLGIFAVISWLIGALFLYIGLIGIGVLAILLGAIFSYLSVKSDEKQESIDFSVLAGL